MKKKKKKRCRYRKRQLDKNGKTIKINNITTIQEYIIVYISFVPVVVMGFFFNGGYGFVTSFNPVYILDMTVFYVEI